MATKINLLGIVVLALLWALLLKGGLLDPEGKQRQNHSPAFSASGMPGEDGPYAGKARVRKEAAPVSSQRNDAIHELEIIARTNPELIGYLHVPLFNSELDPDEENWKLLGADKSKITEVADELKGIFKEIRQQELDTASVISRSDGVVQIGLPMLPPEEASRRIEQMEHAYSGIFGPAFSKYIAADFLKSYPFLHGSLAGKNRIVSIRTLSAEAQAATGNKYEITDYALIEGNKITDDAIENPGKYSNWRDPKQVKDIPEEWSQVIGKPD